MNKNLWCTHTMEYFQPLKRKKILSIVTAWLGPEGIMFGKISQPQKDKYCMMWLLHGVSDKPWKQRAGWGLAEGAGGELEGD